MAKGILDPLKCGDCGGETFSLHHRKPKATTTRVGGTGSGGFDGTIVVTCLKCKGTTEISPVPARMDTEGNLCGGWG